MMRTKTDGNMLSLLYKPLCIAFLLFGLFGLIRLRSTVLTLNYDIRTLEEKKMDSLKNTKMLLAERAKIMSIAQLDASLGGNVKGAIKYAANGYIFPDRAKVVHIKRNKGPVPYNASLEMRSKN